MNLNSQLFSELKSLHSYLRSDHLSGLSCQSDNSIPSIMHLYKLIKNILTSFFQKSQPAVIYIVEGHEKARSCERKHSLYFQDGHRKCKNGMPEFKKDTAFLPSTFSGKVKKRKLKHTEKLRTPENTLQGRNDGRLMPGARRRPPVQKRP